MGASPRSQATTPRFIGSSATPSHECPNRRTINSAFSLISQFDLPKGKGKSWTHPVISDGKLHLCWTDALHVYDLREGATEASALFDKLDADKDGFVSEAELTALWKR